MDTKNKIWLSIITVVYNSEKNIEGTINSIAEQSLQNFEYIIIDGGSKDKTVEIIRKNQKHITQWISEPDSGLYDAMNKGLSVSKGCYVWFINSGDKLYESNCVEKLYNLATKNNFPEVIYGETIIIDENDNEIGLRRLKTPKVLTWKSLINGLVVCHQSFIVKKNIAPKYDLKSSIAADFEWILKSLKNASKIINANMVVSKYLDNGFSKNNILKAIQQRFVIMIREYGFFPTIFQHFIIGFRFFIYVLKNRRF